jgi:hypothetical protein
MMTWRALGDRLLAVNPKAHTELLVELRELVESNERAAALPPLDFARILRG